MIKALLKDSGLEEPVLEGAFSDEEKRSITNMVNEINRETKEAMNASTGAEKAEENGSGAESVS